MEVSARLIEIEGTKYFQGIVRDITEHKRAEEVLRESEDRYRALVEHAPVAIFVNRANQVVLANEACLLLFMRNRGGTTLGQVSLRVVPPPTAIPACASAFEGFAIWASPCLR